MYVCNMYLCMYTMYVEDVSRYSYYVYSKYMCIYIYMYIQICMYVIYMYGINICMERMFQGIHIMFSPILSTLHSPQ